VACLLDTPRHEARVADSTKVVHVLLPALCVASYTHRESNEATPYAVEFGGSAAPLPLSPPHGYTVRGRAMS
jgi:hypothetical protein